MANQRFSRYIPRNSNHSPSQSSGPLAVSASSSVNEYKDAGLPWWSEQHTALFTNWASAFEKYNDGYNNPYFDYFYTGQDVQVTIDGLTNPTDILPIYAFGYNIQQQKMPLYGFWDYKYAAVMRGTRVVSGAFSVVSMYPQMMTDAIAKAAILRSKLNASGRVSNISQIRGLDVDEQNIDKYWRKNYDPDTQDQHIFSVHPPFNLIIEYGMQETSLVAQSSSARTSEIRNKFKTNDPLMSDTNERLVKNPTRELGTKILLENVELMSKSVEYNTDGSPLIETYSFMARDERFLGTNKRNQEIQSLNDYSIQGSSHTGLPTAIGTNRAF